MGAATSVTGAQQLLLLLLVFRVLFETNIWDPNNCAEGSKGDAVQGGRVQQIRGESKGVIL